MRSRTLAALAIGFVATLIFASLDQEVRTPGDLFCRENLPALVICTLLFALLAWVPIGWFRDRRRQHARRRNR